MGLEDIIRAEVLPTDTKIMISLIKQLAREIVSLRSAINKLQSCEQNCQRKEND